MPIDAAPFQLPPDPSELPAPPAGPELDVRNLVWMRLDIVRLSNSDSWFRARNIPHASHAMLNLWMRAWHQVPSGSLPNDDAILSHWADIPAGKWQDVKSIAMSGFDMHSDGRFYHPVIVEYAIEAMLHTVSKSEQGRKAANKRWDAYREKQNAIASAGSAGHMPGQMQQHHADYAKNEKKEKEEKQLAGIDSKAKIGKANGEAVRAEAYDDESTTRTREVGMAIFERLVERFGWQTEIGLSNARAIAEWLGGGSSENEIVDTIVAIVERNKAKDPAWKPRSWQYFDSAVIEARAPAAPAFIPRAERLAAEKATRLKAWHATGYWGESWGLRPDDPSWQR